MPAWHSRSFVVSFSKPILALLSIAVFLFSPTSRCPAKTLTYRDFLGQLTDLDRLAFFEDGVRPWQFSSWHRGERKKWGTNGDAGHYIRIEPNGEAVMMEMDGPGCIYRIWSANPQGKLHVYIDGATKPTFVWDFNKLFTGETYPFVKPLVYKRGSRQSASDCYLPIPFAKHIKICADKARGQFYAIDGLSFPKSWSVESFRLPLTAAEKGALEKAQRAWHSPGIDPKPTLPDQATIKKRMEIAPGKTVILANLKGPGAIRALRMRVTCKQRYFWRKLVLRCIWDGAPWPQVLAPIGPFFGFDWQTANYKSLIAGCADGQCYFYYVMPFRQTARMELSSFLEVPAKVELEIEWAPTKKVQSNMAYFFARWRHEPDCKTFDYPFIETAGHGHLVGITLQIDHPVPGWWGEGDEKVWVDDDKFPRWIGTGSEDYFGDAWGIRYLPGPSFGCSLNIPRRTCPYRWHFMERIPFSKRLRMTIENYGSWGVPGHEHEYNSVAFWYQQERVPPFEQLKGAKYVGGEKVGQKPAEYEYTPDIFPDITAEQTRTYGLDIPYATEAETVLQAAIRAGKAKIITDALLPYEFNMERAVDFGVVKKGTHLGDFTLVVPEKTVYYPRVFIAPIEAHAALRLILEGKTLKSTGRPQKNVLDFQGLLLGRGPHEVKLVAASEGRAIIDCIQMKEATSIPGVMEAEKMRVVSVSEGAPRPKPLVMNLPASGGSVLEWSATKPGQTLTLELSERPSGEYVLAFRAVTGPDCAILQAVRNGQPSSEPLDLFSDHQHLSTRLSLGSVPPGTSKISIRIVGKNPKSSGYTVRIDYFRFEPKILTNDTAPGVTATVAATRGCAHRIQNLGPNWMFGHHLWIQPCRKNGYVDIALRIPKTAKYAVSVRYTTSWDYAKVQAFLDGEKCGEPVDCLSSTVKQTPEITLAVKTLKAGTHILRFQAVDKNPDSLGYLMGIDYVRVKKAR